MKADKLLNYLFYFSVLVFFIGFNFSDNPQGGWQLQMMPDLNGRSISDITFVDSLIGYATAFIGNDTNYALKTTNGGNNWFYIYRDLSLMRRIQFLNTNTGYLCGSYLKKTTNGGINWIHINTSGISAENMWVHNEDTIWITLSESMTGGVFRSTNGGLNWTQQLSAGNQNPDKIYMYNARIGFIGRGTLYKLWKTTDGGFNWFNIFNEGFSDIYFKDSLTGWICFNVDSIKKTTNGGYNWVKILLPPTGGFYNLSFIEKLSVINNDTIYGVGSNTYSINGFRGLIYKTTNGGINWGYQLPDINQINIPVYYHIKFLNNFTGWAYFTNKGIHTISGGDTTIYTGLENNYVNELPNKFELYQNYPNPFNSMTNVKFQMLNSGFAEIKLFDISGKMIKILTSRKYNSGEYTISFDAGSLSSGIYFYSLIVDGIVVDTKKATLIK